MKRKTKRRGCERSPIVWHYTVGAKAVAILPSGVLLTEAETSPHALLPGHRGCVWFSSNDVWEETANKGWMDDATGTVKLLSKRETAERCGGLVRIGVRLGCGIEYWPTAKHKLGLSAGQTGRLERHGVARGADPRQWYFSRKPVLKMRWAAVEVYNSEGRWQRVWPTSESPAEDATA